MTTTLITLLGSCCLLLLTAAPVADSAVQPFDIDEFLSTASNSTTPLRCAVCTVVVEALSDLLDSRAPESSISKLADRLCVLAKIEDRRVCKGIMRLYAVRFPFDGVGTPVLQQEFVYIGSKIALNAATICGDVLRVCPHTVRKPAGWTLPIPGVRGPLAPWTTPPAGAPTLNVLHITDLHVDAEYVEGAEADCGEPDCCQATSPVMGNVSAGRWGTPGVLCDIPMRTVASALHNIAATQKIDLVIWTGDTPSHHIWQYTRAHHVALFDNVTRMIMDALPGVPVLPAVGNHDMVPTDQFPDHTVPSRYTTEWMYELLATTWGEWVKDNGTADDIRWRASYVTRPFAGLRVISLNTIYAWLKLLEGDLDGTLAWLIRQLDEAEAAGDKVWIITHIANRSTTSSWSALYYAIINRYANTVRGQFAGHSHDDEFSIMYDTMDGRQPPTGVQYIAPSLTSYSVGNPAYRVYTVDGVRAGSSYAVLDHSTYMMNISQANAADAPVWVHEYAALSAYGMHGASPADWHALTTRMMANETLVDMYNRYYLRTDVTAVCDRKCQFETICTIRKAVNADVPGSTKLCFSPSRSTTSRSNDNNVAININVNVNINGNIVTNDDDDAEFTAEHARTVLEALNDIQAGLMRA